MAYNNNNYSNNNSSGSNQQGAGKKMFMRRKRSCPLSGDNAPEVSYLNIKLLSKFTSERGKIMPSRITAISAKKQRLLAREIKRARTLALMPYVGNMK